jgi:hypothetical protein
MGASSGSDWQPTPVKLPLRRSENLQPRREHLGRHLVFDAIEAALVLPASTLRRSVLHRTCA